MTMAFLVNGKQVPESDALDIFRMSAFKVGMSCTDTIIDTWRNATESGMEVGVEMCPEEAREVVADLTGYKLEIIAD